MSLVHGIDQHKRAVGTFLRQFFFGNFVRRRADIVASEVPFDRSLRKNRFSDDRGKIGAMPQGRRVCERTEQRAESRNILFAQFLDAHDIRPLFLQEWNDEIEMFLAFDVDRNELDHFPRRSMAALMNALKRGCGASGRAFSSGWTCVPSIKGCCSRGNSAISM